MIVRQVGKTLQRAVKVAVENVARYATPVLRIYTRTVVSSKQKYTEGYIQIWKKNVEHTTPVAFRYIRGSELVQRLTAVAFDMISDHVTLQEWYAHQWESLCSMIVSIIETEYQKVISSQKEEPDKISQPISIDSYIIEDKIGDVSTCAAVYRALRDEEPVALKAMFNFAWENEDDMMRFDNFGAELVTNRLDFPPHPNVIKINAHFVASNVPHSHSAVEEYPAVFEYGQESTLYIEMPLYSCSMSEYLASVTLTETQTTWVLYQIVSAVHHIHSHGIVHRDIKLDNILVKVEDDCLDVVLTDFGMAHDSLRGKRNLDRKWGNPMLMPPEIALSNKPDFLDYTKSDVWCVGSLVYQLMGAENPFSKLQSSKYHARELPPLPSDNPVLCNLVSRLLSRDPDVRPSPRQCLLVCGALLWLPDLFQTQDLTPYETARQLTLLSWQTFKAGLSGAGVELVGLMYFLRFASGMELWRVICDIRL